MIFFRYQFTLLAINSLFRLVETERVFFIQSFVEAFEIRGWHFLLVKIDFLASGTYFFLFLRYCF